MDYKLELHEFFVEGGNREKSHVLLHITEPSTPSEKQKGYFFAVCELNNAQTKDIVALQNIVDEIENRYYEAPESINENPLETVLKKINREEKNFSQDTKINCLVGVVRQEQIIFSSCGQPKMLLFYQTKDGLYKKMNLVSPAEAETEDQLFSQIVEGKITPHDYIFVATPQLKDFFDDDRLQKIITSRLVRQSAQHIEKVLSDIRDTTSFGGLIIHLKEEAFLNSAVKKRTILPGGSVKSLNNLFATEKNTTATLSPSLFPKLNRSFQNTAGDETNEMSNTANTTNLPPAEINSAHLRQYQAKKPDLSQQDTTKEYIKIVALGLWTAIKFLGNFIWMLLVVIFKTGAAVGHFFALLFFIVTNYQNRRRNILENWRQQWYNLKSYFKNLPRASKIFFGASTITLIVFISSIIVIRSRQINIAEEKLSQDLIRQMIVHKNAAESAIIYKDDATVINETQAAKQLLSQLNCKKYTTQCNELGQQIGGLLSQIRKESIVTPELIYDWSPASFNLKYLTRINNKILAFSENSSTVMIYDLLTKQAKNIPGPVGQINDVAVPKENDYAAILFDNKNIAFYSANDDSFKSADVSYSKTDVKISNILIYNRRLYSLDIFNNQIYKHDNIKNGFGEGKDWLKDLSVDLKNSVSMTIDGDLFVSQTNGDILKITAGNKQLFSVSGLDPALKASAIIWTYTDKQYIYVLDGQNKRLIILDKDGHLNKQITAKEWKNPIGMTIDEQNKRAFVLDSDKLWEINL